VTVFRSIFVKHNAEIAHRLSQLPGKCQQIHGHSLQFTIELRVSVDQQTGIARGFDAEPGWAVLDFGMVKQKVRQYIDDQFDHHLLLNAEDSLVVNRVRHATLPGVFLEREDIFPGLMTMPGDPTIENIARWTGEWVNDAFGVIGVEVRVDETNTNGATWSTNR
jgi:6-pyruvoyltetrahydropterin/6-carboxytetrahydropterin synthase